MLTFDTLGSLGTEEILRLLNQRGWLRGAYLHAWARMVGADDAACPVSELVGRLRHRGGSAYNVLDTYKGHTDFITLDPAAKGVHVARWTDGFKCIETDLHAGALWNVHRVHVHKGTTLWHGLVIPVCSTLLNTAIEMAHEGFSKTSTNAVEEQRAWASALATYLNAKFDPVNRGPAPAALPPAPPVLPPLPSLGLVGTAAPYSVRIQDPVIFYSNTVSKDTTMNHSIHAGCAAPSVTARRVVLVRIMDNDPALLVEHSHVFDSGAITTESDDQTTIMQALADYDINAEVARHNEVRASLTDETILRTTGQDVKLRPIKLKDLTITVVRV